VPHSLFEDFKEGGYHSSILSTFSTDPAFYDASLQLRLRSYGCVNNLLIADAAMLDQALETIPEAFASAGRKYLIEPIVTPGCFHAKIAVRYGKSKARMIVGSANVTTAGWAGNLELVSALQWNARDETADNEVYRRLIVRAHRWLTDQSSGDSKVGYKLELLRSQSPWIDDETDDATGPFTLSDEGSIDLLLSGPADAEGLSDRMLALVDEPIERLTIISPYWDDRLAALKRLHQALGHPDLRIFLSLNKRNPSRSSTFPVEALGDLKPTFHPIGEAGDADGRFLHAKLFVFHGTDHDFLFFGSANCTTAALGFPAKAGANHECLLFRKLHRGTAKQLLELTYSKKIALADIASPPVKVERPKELQSLDPGVIEQRAKLLIWTPSPNAPSDASAITIGTEDFPLIQREDGIWLARPSDERLTSTVARIRHSDGRLSRPVIITNTEALMHFAPFPMADSLRRKLDAVLQGEADLIGLARDIHLLLDDDVRIAPLLERIRASGARNSSKSVIGRDYANADEFRKSLNLHASMKSAGIVHGDSPALQALLQIVLRGMVSIANVDQSDASAANAAKDLNAGEDQDDEGLSDVDEFPPRQPPASVEPDVISIDEFHRNQAALWRGIGQFQGFLERIKVAQSDLNLNFVTRSLFMLYLMLHGCTKQYRIEGAGAEVLIQFGSTQGEEFRDSFLHIAAQIVLSIWGPTFPRSLISRLRFNIDDNALPIQIVTLTIISRWVLAAILSEVRGDPTQKSLRVILEKQVPNLFAATKVFPIVAESEQLMLVKQMEQNIGIETQKALKIRTTLQELLIGSGEHIQ
jgi:hypothetical protein